MLSKMKKMLVVAGIALNVLLYSASTMVVYADTSSNDVVYYKVKVRQNIEEGGTTSNDKKVEAGGDCRIHAYPAKGYKFVGWYKDGKLKSTSQDYHVKDVDCDKKYIACFEKDTPPAPTSFKVSIAMAPAGTGIVSGAGTYTVGSQAIIGAVANPGYQFAGWYINGACFSTDPIYTIANVNTDFNIGALFTPAQTTRKSSAGSSSRKTTTAKQETVEEEKKPEDSLPEGCALKTMSLTIEQAQDMIRMGKAGQLLDGAHDAGDFDVVIENQMANGQEEYMSNASIRNISDFVADVFSTEEIIQILSGSKGQFSAYIENVDYSISESDKKQFEDYKGDSLKIAVYMDIDLYKIVDDQVSSVTTLPRNARITIQIPERFRSEGRKFYMIRKHVGEDGNTLMSVLEDEDSEEGTITFNSDKFSTYALAYTQKDSGAVKAKNSKSDDPWAEDEEPQEGATLSIGNGDLGSYILLGVIAAMACVTIITVIIIVVNSKK